MNKINYALFVPIASAVKNFNRIRAQVAFGSQTAYYIKLFFRKLRFEYDFFLILQKGGLPRLKPFKLFA